MNGLQPTPLEIADARAEVSALLAAAGPRWLESQRWFADKGRAIEQCVLDDLLVGPLDHGFPMLAVATVSFVDGSAARYLLPLSFAASATQSNMNPIAPSDTNLRVLIDGTEFPQFGSWLLNLMEGRLPPESEAWRFESPPEASDLFDYARESPGVPMRGEQSNTSIRFNEALVVKLFRRLQAGPNPDEEVLRALDGVRFTRVPRFAGSGIWRSPDGTEFPIALAQAFVANEGDGWTWTLQRLRTVAGLASPIEFTAERLLGRRTAELHLALSQSRSPDFAPQTTNPDTIASEIQRIRQSVDSAVALLHEHEAALPSAVREQLPAVAAELRAAVDRADGLLVEAGLFRIRSHGDFHLGQTLRTPDGDWTIIDFEGEPARPVDERRQRASVLKDVAGMLRSFAYARGVAQRELAARAELDEVKRLADWELGARRAFLAAYRETIGSAGIPLIPADDEAFSRALAVWELDKALYEITYEVRNRPGWVEIPLDATRSLALDHASDATGAAPA